jgi:RNA polymerase sigma-70 factor, ECF subfamily
LESPQFDITLYNCVRRDDRLALNTLFTRYYNKLCSFADSYLRNKADAEEIVSDVFINLWKSRHSIHIKNSVRAYLYISVKHAAFSKIKNRRADIISFDDIQLESPLVDNYSPIEVLAFNEMQNHLRAVINTLPPRCKQIFLMKWGEGLTYKEIGEILGLSTNTVENQVVKALDLVRKSIRKFQSAL